MSENRRPCYLSEQEEREIVDEYFQGRPIKEILVAHQIKTHKSIMDKIKKYYPDRYDEIIKNHKNLTKGYHLDFSEITSDFYAYLVGLIMTDGCVNTENGTIELDLADEDCISFAAKGTGNKYHTYQYDENLLPIHRIVWHDKEAVKQLERFGVVPRKSLIIQPPTLHENEITYLPYLFRGILDGNGCITHTSYGAPMITLISASKPLAEWYLWAVQHYFFLRYVHFNTCVDKHENYHDRYTIGTTNLTDIYKIQSIIYDKPYGMGRKYNKLREMLRDYNEDNLHDVS